MEKKDQLERLQFIVQHLEDKKGVNPLVLDVRGFSNVTDYLVIVDGHVNRHVSAMGRTLVREMREKFFLRPERMEGVQAGEWILLDYTDIIVHIFMPGLRERYDLERLWADGKKVDIS